MAELPEGAEVIVTLPSGREIAGHILCWIRGRADVRIHDGRWPGRVGNYPRSWTRLAFDEDRDG